MNHSSSYSSAEEFNQKAILVDLHHDIALDVINRRQRGEKEVFRRIWLPRLRKAGVKVQVFPIFLDNAYLPEMAMRRELAMIHYLLNEIDQNPTEIRLALDYRDIQSGLESNQIVAILALEGAEGIDSELTMIDILYRLGVRIVSLTWNRRTIFADGAGVTDSKAGLTPLGVELVHRMEELGILIDVSHLSEAGFWSVFEVTRKPAIASHSNARALCDHPRNLTDAQLRALATRGGVVGILIHPGVIDPCSPTISRVVDHIAYIADLVGIEHVALGTDFIQDLTGLDHTPTGDWLMKENEAFTVIPRLSEITELPNLTAEMLNRGFNMGEVQKVLGQNCLDVFRNFWN